MPRYRYEVRMIDATKPCPAGFQEGKTVTRGKRAGQKVCVKKVDKANDVREIDDLAGLMNSMRVGEGTGAGARGYSGFGASASARARSRSRSRSANRGRAHTTRRNRNHAMGGRNRSSSRSPNRSSRSWGGDERVTAEADNDNTGLAAVMKKLGL